MSCYGCKHNSKLIDDWRTWCKEPTFEGGVPIATKGDCPKFESALIASLEPTIKTVNKKKVITISAFPERKNKYAPIRTGRKADPEKQKESKTYILKCIQDMGERNRKKAGRS